MNNDSGQAAGAAPVLQVLNISSWKRDAVRLCFPQHRLIFTSQLQADLGQVLRWGSAPDAVAADYVMEDGFIRSVGLGADLVKPMSLVVDPVGIYYDATRPSQLELLLQQTDFSAELLQRSAALRQRIVAAALTKYNLSGEPWQRPETTKPVVLVVGQVESDASVRLGSPQCQSNAQLLAQVRQCRPDAYLVYKPHPDVMAGLRRAGSADQADCPLADEVLTSAPMQQLLTQVDEVHVMTSLAGFEALLRAVPVVCHGLPFYAGWGLTTDLLSTPRRTRRLTLDELVAATLILYPRYFDRANRHCITVEQALDELIRWRQGPAPRRWWVRLKRLLLRRIVGVR